jgi:hypothetical protein
LKVLDNDVYNALATRSYVQHHQPFGWIYGPEYSNPVISLENEFQEMDLPPIYAIVSFYSGSQHAKAFYFSTARICDNIF